MSYSLQTEDMSVQTDIASKKRVHVHKMALVLENMSQYLLTDMVKVG